MDGSEKAIKATSRTVQMAKQALKRLEKGYQAEQQKGQAQLVEKPSPKKPKKAESKKEEVKKKATKKATKKAAKKAAKAIKVAKKKAKAAVAKEKHVAEKAQEKQKDLKKEKAKAKKSEKKISKLVKKIHATPPGKKKKAAKKALKKEVKKLTKSVKKKKKLKKEVKKAKKKLKKEVKKAKKKARKVALEKAEEHLKKEAKKKPLKGRHEAKTSETKRKAADGKIAKALAKEKAAEKALAEAKVRGTKMTAEQNKMHLAAKEKRKKKRAQEEAEIANYNKRIAADKVAVKKKHKHLSHFTGPKMVVPEVKPGSDAIAYVKAATRAKLELRVLGVQEKTQKLMGIKHPMKEDTKLEEQLRKVAKVDMKIAVQKETDAVMTEDSKSFAADQAAIAQARKEEEAKFAKETKEAEDHIKKLEEQQTKEIAAAKKALKAREAKGAAMIKAEKEGDNKAVAKMKNYDATQKKKRVALAKHNAKILKPYAEKVAKAKEQYVKAMARVGKAVPAEPKTVKKKAKHVKPVHIAKPKPVHVAKPVYTGPYEWQYTQGEYAALFAVIGFITLLFGYRFYMPVLWMGGLVFGVVGTDFICFEYDEPEAAWVVPLVGIIFATLCLLLYRLGTFILGANWGVAMALLLNGVLIAPHEENNLALGVTAAVFAIVFGCATTCYHQHRPTDNACGLPKVLIFAKTSWAGAYMLLWGAGHLVGDYPNELELSTMESIPSVYYTYVGVTCAVAVLAFLVQMRFTHWPKCGRDASGEEVEQAVTAAESQALMDGMPNFSYNPDDVGGAIQGAATKTVDAATGAVDATTDAVQSAASYVTGSQPGTAQDFDNGSRRPEKSVGCFGSKAEPGEDGSIPEGSGGGGGCFGGLTGKKSKDRA